MFIGSISKVNRQSFFIFEEKMEDKNIKKNELQSIIHQIKIKFEKQKTHKFNLCFFTKNKPDSDNQQLTFT